MKNKISRAFKIIALLWFAYSFCSMSLITSSNLNMIINIIVGALFIAMLIDVCKSMQQKTNWFWLDKKHETYFIQINMGKIIEFLKSKAVAKFWIFFSAISCVFFVALSINIYMNSGCTWPIVGLLLFALIAVNSLRLSIRRYKLK